MEWPMRERTDRVEEHGVADARAERLAVVEDAAPGVGGHVIGVEPAEARLGALDRRRLRPAQAQHIIQHNTPQDAFSADYMEHNINRVL